MKKIIFSFCALLSFLHQTSASTTRSDFIDVIIYCGDDNETPPSSVPSQWIEEKFTGKIFPKLIEAIKDPIQKKSFENRQNNQAFKESVTKAIVRFAKGLKGELPFNKSYEEVQKIIENNPFRTKFSYTIPTRETPFLLFIPSEVSKWKKIVQIWIPFNLIQEIPDTLMQLTTLISLNLYGNEILKIPDSISNLKKLEQLYVGSNKIEEFPEALCECTNLIHLEIGKNKIKNIPDKISNLKKLKNLDLCQNEIEGIPKTISGCSSLEILTLTFNKIVFIPDELGALDTLKEFFIEYNQVKEIPNALVHLKNLKKLSFYENKISAISDEIIEWVRKQKIEMNVKFWENL
jgi:hypothetical protein